MTSRRQVNITLPLTDPFMPKFRNYLIFYQPFEETIVVVRVLHAAQDWTRFF
jgi:plasmid stabilization system protein ParE